MPPRWSRPLKPVLDALRGRNRRADVIATAAVGLASNESTFVAGIGGGRLAYELTVVAVWLWPTPGIGE